MEKRKGFTLIVVCQECGQKNRAFYHLLRKTNCAKCHESLLKPDQPQGFVYLLKSGDYYKIGKANDLKKRLSQIKLQLPFDVELVHAIEAFHPHKVEQHCTNGLTKKEETVNGSFLQKRKLLNSSGFLECETPSIISVV